MKLRTTSTPAAGRSVLTPPASSATFHGITLTNYAGNAPYLNGHERILRWQPFPLDYLEQAYEAIGSWPFKHDDGFKDPVTLHRTESLMDYSDELVLNVTRRLR